MLPCREPWLFWLWSCTFSMVGSGPSSWGPSALPGAKASLRCGCHSRSVPTPGRLPALLTSGDPFPFLQSSSWQGCQQALSVTLHVLHGGPGGQGRSERTSEHLCPSVPPTSHREQRACSQASSSLSMPYCHPVLLYLPGGCGRNTKMQCPLKFIFGHR